MITRFLYLAVGWFVISFLATLIVGPRLRRGNWFISIVWLAVVLLIGDTWALLTFGIPDEVALLSALAFIFGLICIRWMHNWNALGQVTWMTSILATFLFIIYAFQVTAFTPLNALSFALALFFFFIEAVALIMAIFHSYESLNAVCRIHWRRRIDHLEHMPGFTPMVSLHVPAYNEPVDEVIPTLRSLAELDYPNYEVLVIDNNTPDDASWRRLETVCRELGPKFHFVHLDSWPGYKSGALNFGLAQTDPRAEIIAPIDADYRVSPSFLKELVPAFIDPNLAFVQTPQDYHDYEGNPYLESTYHGYRFFFEISMPARNEYNAIIFAGTMGLIRKSALQEIGGWDEWCITEDAEASLRILKQGYQSLYIPQSYGQGLIPFSFEALKRQRFRWAFGGIQILKKHWEALMPWAHLVDRKNHLTLSQRYFYLVGGLQWFTDPLNLIFTTFLILGGIFSLLSGRMTVRPLTGTLIVLPAVFLILGLSRFVWVLRRSLKLSWKTAFRSMYNFFSLGWTVTLACLQGLVRSKGVFLRTPKSKSSSKMLQALSATRWETFIGLACLVVGIAAFVANPSVRTLFVCALLLWQASLYLAAPYYSLLSVYEKPERIEGETGTPVMESRAAQYVLVIICLVVISAVVVQYLPRPAGNPIYSRFMPIEILLRQVIMIK